MSMSVVSCVRNFEPTLMKVSLPALAPLAASPPVDDVSKTLLTSAFLLCVTSISSEKCSASLFFSMNRFCNQQVIST